MIVITDGEANCPGCGVEVPMITTANFERIPIDTVFLGTSQMGQQCAQDLASENNGTFHHVQ